MSRRIAKSLVLCSAVATAMMLTACGAKQEDVTLNIGFQKYGVLPIVKAQGSLEDALKAQGVTVKWVEFPAGTITRRFKCGQRSIWRSG